MNNINESTYSRPSSPSSISDSSRMSPTHPHDKHHHKTYTNKNEDTKSKPLPKLNQWLGSAFKNRDGRPSDIQHLLSHSSAVPLPSTIHTQHSPSLVRPTPGRSNQAATIIAIKTTPLSLKNKAFNITSTCLLGFEFCTHNYCPPAYHTQLPSFPATVIHPPLPYTPKFQYQALRTISTSYRQLIEEKKVIYGEDTDGEEEEEQDEEEEKEEEDEDDEEEKVEEDSVSQEDGALDKWDYVWDYNIFRNSMTETTEAWWTNLSDEGQRKIFEILTSTSRLFSQDSYLYLYRVRTPRHYCILTGEAKIIILATRGAYKYTYDTKTTGWWIDNTQTAHSHKAAFNEECVTGYTPCIIGHIDCNILDALKTRYTRTENTTKPTHTHTPPPRPIEQDEQDTTTTPSPNAPHDNDLAAHPSAPTSCVYLDTLSPSNVRHKNPTPFTANPMEPTWEQELRRDFHRIRYPELKDHHWMRAPASRTTTYYPEPHNSNHNKESILTHPPPKSIQRREKTFSTESIISSKAPTNLTQTHTSMTALSALPTWYRCNTSVTSNPSTTTSATRTNTREEFVTHIHNLRCRGTRPAHRLLKRKSLTSTQRKALSLYNSRGNRDHTQNTDISKNTHVLHNKGGNSSNKLNTHDNTNNNTLNMLDTHNNTNNTMLDTYTNTNNTVSDAHTITNNTLNTLDTHADTNNTLNTLDTHANTNNTTVDTNANTNNTTLDTHANTNNITLDINTIAYETLDNIPGMDTPLSLHTNHNETHTNRTLNNHTLRNTMSPHNCNCIHTSSRHPPNPHHKVKRNKKTKSRTWGYNSWGHNIFYNPQYKTTPCYRSIIRHDSQPTHSASRKHMTSLYFTPSLSHTAPAFFQQSPHTAKPQGKTKSQYHKPTRYYTPHRYATLLLLTTIRYRFLTTSGTLYYLFYPP